jgi:ABC-type ATPase involved in cell division
VRGEWNGKHVADAVHAQLARVGLPERGHDSPSALSAGERQRVAVARALVAGPAVVVADEPTRHLGDEPARQMIEILREAHGAGATVVLATHDEAVASAFGGRVFRLAGGRLEGAA